MQKKQKDSEERKRRNRLEQLEKQIESQEAEIESVKEKLSSPDVASDYMKCAELSEKLEGMNETLYRYYSEWEKLQENTADN